MTRPTGVAAIAGRWLAAATVAGLSLAAALGAGAEAAGNAPPRATLPERTLRVFAAASLADAFSEIGQRLERERPGFSVRISFAGSQQLAMQIEQGASADVFASADERWMNHLKDEGMIFGEAPVFARNRMVVIVPGANPARVRRLQDLARAGVKLVLGAEAVPAGRYGRLVLQNLARDPAFGADFAKRVLANVVSEEENVKAVVGKVQLGEADAGIVYRSDVTPKVAGALRVIEIPERVNVLAPYPIAPLKTAREPEGARAFVELVLSREGQAILERHGLIPVSRTHRP